jgi:hypothetical protein
MVAADEAVDAYEATLADEPAGDVQEKDDDAPSDPEDAA